MKPLSKNNRKIANLPKFLQAHLQHIEISSVVSFRDFFTNYPCDCRECKDIAYRLDIKAVS